MTVHERQKPPVGHGEVLCSPPFEEWAELVSRNVRLVASWPAELRALREQAREETVGIAAAFSAPLGLPAREAWTGGPIVMTGHQPELYHPGVWVKDFVVERLSQETGALGVDLVVDTDLCESVTLRVPCLRPQVRVCEIPLVETSGDAAYVQVPVPGEHARSAFREGGLRALTSLPAPALRRHFASFCDALEEAAGGAADLGTLMTAARRRYESSADTGYLEVLASAQTRSAAYRRFAAGLLVDAPRVRSVVNDALAEYRLRTGTRSAAQPFPDLAETDGRVEAPFWLLRNDRRLSVSVGPDGMLYAGDEPAAMLGEDAPAAERALADTDLLLAPRALTLTMFQRVFVADLFVHGTGGGRYDRVTDAVIRAYYNIDAPAFTVASMTLLLPLGARAVTDDEVAAAERRLHRFEHNPDSMLAEVEFDTASERRDAEALAQRKAEAVEAISSPGADRKTLGAEIREVNSQLAALLEPVRRELRDALELIQAERAASAVLTDRTYPYCLWDPREVMDKVR